jgi:hypothetical protein
METRNATKDDKAKAATTEAAAPPQPVGYPDRWEVGQTDEERSVNDAAIRKVHDENQAQADAAAKASAGGAPAPAPKAADDDEDSASRRRAR